MGWEMAVGLGDGDAIGVDKRVWGKEERSFTVVVFGKEKEETEVLREWEREWRWVGAGPLPSLKFSNWKTESE